MWNQHGPIVSQLSKRAIPSRCGYCGFPRGERFVSESHRFRGVVHGKVIQLETEIGLPDGQRVTVSVRPLAQSRDSSGEGIRLSAGAWADDDLEDLEAYLEANRKAATVGSSRDRTVSLLLDTDTCSVHLKLPAGLTSRLVQHAGRLHVAMITVGELMTWARRRGAPSRRLSGIESFLREVETLPVDEKVADTFAELPAGQPDTGRLTPSTDLWIATTAIAHELTLVTHNTRDYERIPRLSLADWIAP